MSDANATPQNSADTDVEFSAQDLALLAEIGTALKTERKELQAQSGEFKSKLLNKIGSGASRRLSGRSAKVLRPLSWTRNLKYYAAAVLVIGLTLTLFAMSGLLGTPGHLGDPTSDIRTARMAAERIPLAMNGASTESSALFRPYDNQKMKLVIDSQDGEPCLALIPQAVIDREYDAAQRQALLSHPNWDLTVEQGRITVPPEAYSKALGTTTGRFFLLKVAGHYEIWTAEALQRYIDRNSKQPGLSGAAPGPTVEQVNS